MMYGAEPSLRDHLTHLEFTRIDLQYSPEASRSGRSRCLHGLLELLSLLTHWSEDVLVLVLEARF
jgi:hypothetical protein